MVKRRSWLQALATYVEDYGAPVTVVLAQGLIAWATSPLWPPNHPLRQAWLFWGGWAATILAGVFLIIRQARMTRVVSERDQFAALIEAQRGSYRAVFEAHLAHISEGLAMTRSERITVYRSKGGKFVPLARYSLNANLREKSRTEYPHDQGCIAVAWAEGKAFEFDLPSFKQQPDEYIRRQKEKWRMPEEVTRGLKMKSRAIAAFLIEDDQRQGVIVFESTNKKLPRTELERIMRIENRHIAHLLRVLAPFEPDLAVATAEGF